jgi:chromate transporter
VSRPQGAPSDGALAAEALPRPGSLMELFRVFSGLALRGFGGVLPWAQRVLVEDRRWMTREQFVEVLAFAQMLPGPNICNLALMVGDRWFGLRGALVALAGLLAGPSVIVLALAMVYGQVADDPVVRRALAGMGAVAGGMIIATAIKLASGQRRNWRWMAFGVAAFVGVALLGIPLARVVAVVVPIAVVAAWFAIRRAPGRGGSPDGGRS